MIGPIDLLHPFQAPCFKIFPVFLTYFPTCSRFSTIHKYAQNMHLTSFFLKFKSYRLLKKSSSFECCLHHGNHGFNFTCASHIICYHATQVQILRILQLFLNCHNGIGDICLMILINKFSFSTFHSIFQFQSVYIPSTVSSLPSSTKSFAYFTV
jgi:hypothetical protein